MTISKRAAGIIVIGIGVGIIAGMAAIWQRPKPIDKPHNISDFLSAASDHKDSDKPAAP